jgi:hypothetical protein
MMETKVTRYVEAGDDIVISKSEFDEYVANTNKKTEEIARLQWVTFRAHTALEDFVNCFVPQTEAEKLCFEQAKQALEQE